jgi:hypothetical protein
MTKHRGMTFRKFVTAVGEELIKRYFDKINKPLPAEIVFSDNTVSQFLDTTGEELKLTVNEDFQTVNDIAERGMNYIERSREEDNIPPRLTEPKGGGQVPENEPRERTAMRLFLDYSDTFQKAYDRYLCLTIGATLTHCQLPENNADFSPQQVEAFKNSITNYYQSCNKGADCSVRIHQENDCYYFLIARGDYVKSDMKWEDGTIKPIFYRPGKEDILVYNPKNKVLGIRTAGKSNDPKIKYIEQFCKNILKVESVDESVYTKSLISLNPFQNKTFNYNETKTMKGIKLLELDGIINGTNKIKISLGSPDLLQSLDEIGVDLSTIELRAVRLLFRIKSNGFLLKPVKIEITTNSRADLSKKQGKEIIEDYLREQGVILYQ